MPWPTRLMRSKKVAIIRVGVDGKAHRRRMTANERSPYYNALIFAPLQSRKRMIRQIYSKKMRRPHVCITCRGKMLQSGPPACTELFTGTGKHVRHTIEIGNYAFNKRYSNACLARTKAFSRILCIPLHYICKLTSKIGPRLNIHHMRFDSPYAYDGKQLTSQESHA
jgi:hypothetical protein